MILTSGTQAIILLTVPFPGDGHSIAPLTPTEWGRFAEWLRAQSLMPEHLLTGQTDILDKLQDKTISRERVDALLGRGGALAILMDKWSRAGLWVMTRADPDYPTRLKKRLGSVSPAVFFGGGNRALLSKGGLAVVGSRNAGADDLTYSRELGRLAAESGHSIISGGARGVDEAAMTGTLECEGTAIGVLAKELLKVCSSAVYREHLSRNNLVLVSSTHPEAGFNTGTAMQRNKYIYCLAEAAVVVHSGLKGGTWSGAQENLKRHWVPLWVKESSDPAAGNRELLADAAARRLSVNVGELSIAALFAAPADANVPPATAAPHLPPDKAPSALETPPQPIPEISTYDQFLDQVRDCCLENPCTEKELTERLNLPKSQLNQWLSKGRQQGHLQRLTNPVRYRWINQPGLFPDSRQVSPSE